jgi:hypothetical protein
MRNQLKGFEQIQALFFLLLLLGNSGAGQLYAQGYGDRGKRSRAGDLYGAIEISVSDFKGTALRLSETEEGFKVIYSETISTTQAQLEEDRLAPAAIKEIVEAVYQLYTRMKTKYKVPENNIYVVGNSRLHTDNSPDLLAALKERVGKTMQLLDPETETQLAIAGTIPLRYRSKTGWTDNRSDSILIDVGSDRIRGGYQVVRRTTSDRSDYDYVTLNIDKGLLTVSDEIDQIAGKDGSPATYALTAKKVCSASIGAALREEIERKPGLVNRQHVYLAGGIVRAMMTLLRPDDRRPFVPIFEGEIEIFYRTLTGDPDSLQKMLLPDLTRRVSNPSIRRDIEKEVESVRKAYSTKDLIAGAELLKTIASELKLSGKTVRLARLGQVSWILAYVRAQTEL